MSNRNMKVMKVRGPRQNLRKPNGSARRSSATDPALNLKPAFPGQYCTTMILPGDPAVLSTTVTSGAIANVAQGGVDIAHINNFATRFAGFEEYRITKAKYTLRNFSSVNPGVGNMWVDDSGNVAAPTATEAQERQGIKKFSWADVNKVFELTYVPHSPTEQIWNPIATSQTLASFKIYTDNANFGSSVVATQYCEVQSVFTVQFRGLK